MHQQIRAFLLRDLAASAGQDIAALGLSAPVRASASWVDGALAVELDDKLLALIGEDGLLRAARHAALRSVRQGALAPLTRIVVKLFDGKPEAMFRWGPGFYAAGTRGIGRMAFSQASERAGTVTFVDIPELQRASRGWHVEMRGRIMGGFDVIGVETAVDELPDGTGFSIRW